MIDLRTHIEEALFSNKEKDAEKLSKTLELNALKKISYDKSTPELKTESPWEIGSVAVDKGYNVILTRPDTEDHHRYAEFYLDFEGNKRLPSPFKKIKTFENYPHSDQGTLIIENYPEKDFTKLFTNDCEIDVAEIWVRHCKNLKSLKGWPKNTKTNSFIVTDCAKLNDLTDLPAAPYIQIEFTDASVKSFINIPKETAAAAQKVSLYMNNELSYEDEGAIKQLFNKKCIVSIFEKR